MVRKENYEEDGFFVVYVVSFAQHAVNQLMVSLTSVYAFDSCRGCNNTSLVYLERFLQTAVCTAALG